MPLPRPGSRCWSFAATGRTCVEDLGSGKLRGAVGMVNGGREHLDSLRSAQATSAQGGVERPNLDTALPGPE